MTSSLAASVSSGIADEGEEATGGRDVDAEGALKELLPLVVSELDDDEFAGMMLVVVRHMVYSRQNDMFRQPRNMRGNSYDVTCIVDSLYSFTFNYKDVEALRNAAAFFFFR